MGTVRRTAEVTWSGSLEHGRGSLRTGSGTLDDTGISWQNRVGTDTGGAAGETTPEELIAAALGSCYSMSLTHFLSRSGFAPDSLGVTATCQLDRNPSGITVRQVEIDAVAELEGMEQQRFDEIAQSALDNCPVAHLIAGNATCELRTSLRRPAAVAGAGD